MSQMVILGLAGTFGLALSAFVVTSAVALPFLAYDELKARRRPTRF